ncbi:MAG: glucose-6-phosphate 1-dehydrogenase [Chitinophagaceae bacterium]|nr:glucose-6-phosphate 1-dehydrogenase [Chitinophagaceae bacterium]
MNAFKSQPGVFVIFGATGDLNLRKITPALYNLFLDNWLPHEFMIIGSGRRSLTDEQFRDSLLQGINQFSRKRPADADKWAAFAGRIFYQAADINDPSGYTAFGQRIKEFETNCGQEANVIYYLAVAPSFFGVVCENVAKNKLSNKIQRTRIVFEKPFGHDLESAKALNASVSKLFDEKQIYRIDHYLGKETVQNIMAFRFANSLFEPLWNRNYIEQVQISVTENLGIADRGDYYEQAGALRDMVQNHILQLVCLIAMEVPVSFKANEVRNKKMDVLHAIRKFKSKDISGLTVRGQYSKGTIQGKAVPGYREESKVDAHSGTESFVAMKLNIDNWRWQGIPFYIRTGKRLQQSASIITIQFKDTPHSVFPKETAKTWQQNRLIISIQPEMSIRLQLQTKKPGLEMVLNTVDMLFDYNSEDAVHSPEAYETLLLDVMEGDQTLFMRGDQVEMAWELLMPVLKKWQESDPDEIPKYDAGSWGPEGSDSLLKNDGFHWFNVNELEKKDNEFKSI